MKVRQLANKNQFVVEGKDNTYFQSYDSVCAKLNNKTGELTLYPDWDYSNTTRKHLYIFIDEYCGGRVMGELYSSTNKRQTILKFIKEGVIKFRKQEPAL